METTDPQVTGRRLGGSFTIPEWCEHRRVSISMYYKLKAQGKAPATLADWPSPNNYRRS